MGSDLLRVIADITFPSRPRRDTISWIRETA